MPRNSGLSPISIKKLFWNWIIIIQHIRGFKMDYTISSNSTQPSNPDLDPDEFLTSQSPQIESLQAEESLAGNYMIPPAFPRGLNSTCSSNMDLNSEPGPSLQSPQVESLPVEEIWGTDLLVSHLHLHLSISNYLRAGRWRWFTNIIYYPLRTFQIYGIHH